MTDRPAMIRYLNEGGVLRLRRLRIGSLLLAWDAAGFRALFWKEYTLFLRHGDLKRHPKLRKALGIDD